MFKCGKVTILRMKIKRVTDDWDWTVKKDSAT